MDVIKIASTPTKEVVISDAEFSQLGVRAPQPPRGVKQFSPQRSISRRFRADELSLIILVAIATHLSQI